MTPVNAVDSDGRLAQTMTGGGGGGSGGSGVGISGNRPWSPPRPQAPISGNRPWSPPKITTDEEILSAINSKKDFVYKGVSVKRHSSKQLTSFAINNKIFLNLNVNEAGITSEEKINTLKHEYGHTRQQVLFGDGLYVTEVAVPSVYNAYRKLSPNDYYSQPWEWWADKLGGAKREENFYNPGTAQRGYAYILDVIYLKTGER